MFPNIARNKIILYNPIESEVIYMFIKCKNITDFNWMMNTALLNEDKNARLFISHKDSFPPVCVSGGKCNISFTYAFFSSLYTVVYEELVYKDIRI